MNDYNSFNKYHYLPILLHIRKLFPITLVLITIIEYKAVLNLAL